MPGSAQAIESLNTHVARMQKHNAVEERRQQMLPRHTVEVVIPPSRHRRTGIQAASQTSASG